MTVRRFVTLFLVALACEVGVFAVSYRDLLSLRHGAAASEAGSAAFGATAGQALSRSHLTREHLETIAAGAARLEMRAVEIDALSRLTREYPADVRLKLRLADALRRAGDYARAEAVYMDVLSTADATARHDEAAR